MGGGPRSQVFFFLWACGEKVGCPVDRWSSLPTGCFGEPIHSASSSVGWQHSRSFALPLHHRWFLTRKQKVSDMYFTPGLMKSSDDENGVKLKLTCGAVMDEENLYFDMFDLYIDCTETFIKGCDILTKPKMEGLRSMLFVHSIWGGDGEEEKLSAGPFYLTEYFAEDDEDDAPKTLFNPIYVEEYEDKEKDWYKIIPRRIVDLSSCSHPRAWTWLGESTISSTLTNKLFPSSIWTSRSTCGPALRLPWRTRRAGRSWCLTICRPSTEGAFFSVIQLSTCTIRSTTTWKVLRKRMLWSVYLSRIKGSKGEQGDRGPKGDRGQKGESGSVGPQGERGLRGEQGPSDPFYLLPYIAQNAY